MTKHNTLLKANYKNVKKKLNLINVMLEILSLIFATNNDVVTLS